MSLFEDLVEELKEENLIEETVIETSRTERAALNDKSSVSENIPENNILPDKNFPSTKNKLEDSSVLPEARSANDSSAERQNNAKTETGFEIAAAEQFKAGEIVAESNETKNHATAEKDFYRRRATEEVTALQIVEHILNGVEREQMKIPPKSYDDIPVSLALHDFLKITGDPNSPEHSLAEFKLMGETESWHSALLRRDKFIAVGDLRRYCESTRAPLSSQALASLARFYRNSPFSDAVRNKFDLIMTRLVTKESKDHKREILFEREELIQHLSDLYADWSSIPLYAADDDSEVLIAALKFEDFITEAQEADSFESLVKKDFFNRLRIFKDSIGENFFSPLLTATAIECNVSIGNRYVELIEAERDNNNSEILEEKYNFLLDQPVSDATSKTLQLIELLKIKKEETEENSAKAAEPEEKITLDTPVKFETRAESEPGESLNPPKADKRKLALIILLAIFLLGGLYFVVNYFSATPAAEPVAEKINMEESAFRDYFKAARIDNDTFYAVTLPSWKDLSTENKEDIINKILAKGKTQGYKKIHLMNNDGKTVGSASQENGVELSEF